MTYCFKIETKFKWVFFPPKGRNCILHLPYGLQFLPLQNNFIDLQDYAKTYMGHAHNIKF